MGFSNSDFAYMVAGPTGPRRAAGMTLLEVLVACGVLVLAMSGVAALMAAASSLVSEAAFVDETAALIANARAEIHNRQICSLQAFQSGTSLPGVRTACLGELQQRIISISSIVSSATATATPLWGPSAYVATRVDGPEVTAYRSFASEDRLIYSTDGGASPRPMLAGGTAFHDSQQRACWGGLLTLVDGFETPIPLVTFPTASPPSPHPASSGTLPNLFRSLPARLDVVVFKQRAAATGVPSAVLLISETTSRFFVTGTDVHLPQAATAESVGKTYLGGCSYVLALPPPVGQMPNMLSRSGEGLRILDRADGSSVLGGGPGLMLKDRFVVNDPFLGQRLFYRVSDCGPPPNLDSGQKMTQAQLVSIFGCLATLSDAVGVRTKTTGPFTVRLPTASESLVVLQSAPAGRYWTSTRQGNVMLVYDTLLRTCQPPQPGETCFAALEVACSPMWYRIQASWPTRSTPVAPATFPVSVIISDPSIYEFPRIPVGPDPANAKWRVVAFDGLTGVESTYLVVE